MCISRHEKGFTFIEIIIACLILTFLIAAVLHYHASAGASKNQEYYLKAVQTAKSELSKLAALYELKSGISEFEATGPPPNVIFLGKYDQATETLVLPAKIFKTYYSDHGYSTSLLRALGKSPPYSPNEISGVSQRQTLYCETYQSLDDDDDLRDMKTFTYFVNDGNTVTDYDCSPGNCKLDLAGTVIDDMGSPLDCEDDFRGIEGWWIEDAGVISGVTHLKKVTFAFQFWYPGQNWTRVDPEVIVLKTTLVKP